MEIIAREKNYGSFIFIVTPKLKFLSIWDGIKNINPFMNPAWKKDGGI